MAVPTNVSELDPVAGNNYPAGSESPSTLDNYLRAHASFIAQLRDDGALVYTKSEVDALLTAQAAAISEKPGSCKDWPASTPPSGWLVRDGSAVSRTTYAALFAVIGTTWGAGNGTTTFNLPNSVNRMTIGSGGLYAIGATGGSKDAVVVAHTHTGSTEFDGNHSHVMDGGYLKNNASGGGIASGSGVGAGAGTNEGGTHNHAFTTSSSGVSGTNANLPPYVAMLPIIKF